MHWMRKELFKTNVEKYSSCRAMLDALLFFDIVVSRMQ